MLSRLAIDPRTLAPAARLLGEARFLNDAKWRILILTIATFAAMC